MSFMPHPFPPPPSMPHRNATVKLALEGPNAEKEGPFVRVQLSGVIGQESLETLRKRAVDLWEMTHGTLDSDLDDVKVVFTYRDAENDLCFIFSEEDLRCALPMFPVSLRMFARIEQSKVSERADSKSTQTSDNKFTQTAQTASTKFSTERSFSDIPVHKVVETLAGVLTAANSALQNHVRNAPNTKVDVATGECPKVDVATGECKSASAFNPGPSEATCIVDSEDSKGAAEPSSEERLFIHGRHTCDSCLTTPIVGKRFHAVNMPDYDLCSTCRDNYKGSEIEFEESELDRDRPMQERWHRRFNKWSQKSQRQAQVQANKEERLRRRCGSRCGQPNGMNGPANRINRPNPGKQAQGGNGPQGWNKHPRFFGPPPAMCGPPPDQVDHALKEAIRLSMIDFTEKNKSQDENSTAQSEENTTKASENDTIQRAEETAVGSQEKTVERRKEDEEEEFLIPPEAPVGAPPAGRALEVIVKKVEENSKSNVAASKEDSFSDDAIGNGEVATALGETMDAIANVINEMNELETENPIAKAFNEISAEFEKKIEAELTDETSMGVPKHAEDIAVDASSQSKAGATILSGQEEEDVEEVRSHDGSHDGSWNVVASDEALARAAQVIGSALFESEVNGSQQPSNNQNVSILSSDDSVPTNISSVASRSAVSPVLLSRWALQLRHLHELGFSDDSKNVEIMERLEAANIGSGETGAISVEKVVNELMKEW